MWHEYCFTLQNNGRINDYHLQQIENDNVLLLQRLKIFKIRFG